MMLSEEQWDVLKRYIHAVARKDENEACLVELEAMGILVDGNSNLPPENFKER